LYDNPKKDIQSLKTFLADGAIFRNVTTVDLIKNCASLGMESLAKHIVSFCPKLVWFDFDDGLGSDSSLTPFEDLPKNF